MPAFYALFSANDRTPAQNKGVFLDVTAQIPILRSVIEPASAHPAVVNFLRSEVDAFVTFGAWRHIFILPAAYSFCRHHK
jgi:hypothetical protein